MIQVEQQQADSRTAAAGKAQRFRNRSWSRIRFGRPVSPSWWAKCLIRSSVRLRSVMSTAAPTAPAGLPIEFPNRGGADQDIEPGAIVERDADFLAIYRLAARGPL